MSFRLPQDDTQFKWTSHIKNKMMFYGLSTQKIRTVLKSSDRKEEGVAEGTLAAMKRNDSPKRKEEIWVMYKHDEEAQKKRFNAPRRIMISAWRYPGVTKPGDQIPVPDDILEELGL